MKFVVDISLPGSPGQCLDTITLVFTSKIVFGCMSYFLDIISLLPLLAPPLFPAFLNVVVFGQKTLIYFSLEIFNLG